MRPFAWAIGGRWVGAGAAGWGRADADYLLTTDRLSKARPPAGSSVSIPICPARSADAGFLVSATRYDFRPRLNRHIRLGFHLQNPPFHGATHPRPAQPRWGFSFQAPRTAASIRFWISAVRSSSLTLASAASAGALKLDHPADGNSSVKVRGIGLHRFAQHFFCNPVFKNGSILIELVSHAIELRHCRISTIDQRIPKLAKEFSLRSKICCKEFHIASMLKRARNPSHKTAYA